MSDITPATVSAGTSPTSEVIRTSYATLTAAPAATEPTNSTPYGFSQAQAQKILGLVIEMRAVLVAAGLAS